MGSIRVVSVHVQLALSPEIAKDEGEQLSEIAACGKLLKRSWKALAWPALIPVQMERMPATL